MSTLSIETPDERNYTHNYRNTRPLNSNLQNILQNLFAKYDNDNGSYNEERLRDATSTHASSDANYAASIAASYSSTQASNPASTPAAAAHTGGCVSEELYHCVLTNFVRTSIQKIVTFRLTGLPIPHMDSDSLRSSRIIRLRNCNPRSRNCGPSSRNSGPSSKSGTG
jgi:hypothetical protein